MAKKQTVKVMFVDFWHPATIPAIKANRLYQLLSKRWDLILTSKPEFLFYSVFGYEHLKFIGTRIFYTGENVRPDFECCDYAFSFDYPVTERNFRLPLYRLEPEYDSLFIDRNPSKVLNENRKFCCFIVSNPNASERIAFFNLLSKYKPVDSGGKVLNNIGYQIGRGEKLSWMQKYKFSIVFENSSFPGYTSEKLLHAFTSNTIPIYWGNPLINKDFNTKAFINCHEYCSFDEVVEVVKAIDKSESLYEEYLRQPFIPANFENEFCNEENILNRFELIFSSKRAFISKRTKIKQQLEYLCKKVKRIRTKAIDQARSILKK